jgi:mitochondrial transcription factor 1
VVRRLKPSFASTKPLDIIDINPGVCLLSSKIHQALKPRHHVLVEPNKNVYKSFIDPLLQPKESRYCHVPTLSELFSGEGAKFLPEQTPVTSKILPKGTMNDTLLILANLTSLKAIHSSSGNAVGAINSYINGMMNQENTLHHYGLVRMLAWLPDGEKNALIPRSIIERKKFSVRLDLVAQISEIAGAPNTSYRSPARRQHDLAIQSEQLAAQRAKEAGIWDPKIRIPPPSAIPWCEIGLRPDAHDQLRSLPDRLPWQDEMLALEDAWRKDPLKAVKRRRKQEPRLGRPPSDQPEKLRLLRAKFLTMRKAHTVAQEWARRQSKIDKDEMSLLKDESMFLGMAAETEAIRQRATELHADMYKGRRDLALIARRYIDDRRGFEQRPPLLQWDRRTAEPLVVANDEFYPTKKIALLDFKPAAELLEKLDSFDKRVCFNYLCSILFRNPAKPVRNNLTTVVQGGLDDFVGKVPDVLNPLKGGNPNLDNLRVRTLPLDLLVQLALALETWPFRMQTHEMIMKTGRRKRGIIHDDD